jgi:hypothetical protein
MTDIGYAEGAPYLSLDHNPMMANDALLPSQFYDIVLRSHEPTPEHKLMAALLEDALRCWIGKGTWTVAHRVRLQVEANKWLFGNYESPFSLEQVCDYLCHADGSSLEPNWIRTELRKLPQDGISGLSQFNIVRHASDIRRSITENRRRRRNNHCVRSNRL